MTSGPATVERPVRICSRRQLGNVSGHSVAAPLLWECAAESWGAVLPGPPLALAVGFFSEMHFKVLLLVGVWNVHFLWKQDSLLRHTRGKAFGWCWQLPVFYYIYCKSGEEHKLIKVEQPISCKLYYFLGCSTPSPQQLCLGGAGRKGLFNM